MIQCFYFLLSNQTKPDIVQQCACGAMVHHHKAFYIYICGQQIYCHRVYKICAREWVCLLAYSQSVRTLIQPISDNVTLQ